MCLPSEMVQYESVYPKIEMSPFSIQEACESSHVDPNRIRRDPLEEELSSEERERRQVLYPWSIFTYKACTQISSAYGCTINGRVGCHWVRILKYMQQCAIFGMHY